MSNSPLSASNLAIGSAVSIFEVTTLGQPFEVLKTHLAANRNDRLRDALSKTLDRGGLKGFYQGLIPWAIIESGVSGGILLFAATAVEDLAKRQGLTSGTGGLLGGAVGGAAQAYLAMGVCTCMKTAEITRQKAARIPSSIPGQPAALIKSVSPLEFFAEVWKKEGIRGINKGVNAVALRQMTNWASRMGFARATEDFIRQTKGMPKGSKLDTSDKVIASAVGGALGVWNMPLEVIRVEMQSLKTLPEGTARPQKLTMLSTLKYIYKENGIKGLFRGVTPRIGLGVWRTICLVSLGDYIKDAVNSREKIITATDY